MLLAPGRRRRARTGLRDALRTARETYRRHSRVPAPNERPRDVVVRSAEPDVILDIPNLRIDEIDLELDELQARVALDARVLDLLGLHVGADASLGQVKLDIKGVEAEALLKVRLDNLAGILDRVMDTVDRNPQLLTQLVQELPPNVAGAIRSATAHRRSRRPLAGGTR